MFFEYENHKIYYDYLKKNNAVTIVFLHGWGGSTQSFKGAFDYFSNFYSVLNLDFFGFGKSSPPEPNFSLNDYVKLVDALIQKLELKNVILVGHSFGGRVAIKLSSEKRKYQISKLFLIDSAGIKPKFSFIKFFKIKVYKLKKNLVKKHILSSKYLTNSGSLDYKILSDEQKAIFVRIVNEFLENELKKISTKTIIIWGNKDKETPLYMAKKMNKLINNSLIFVLHGGHYAYIENHLQFCNILLKFIGE